jgi:hypothetical protein
MVLEYLYPAVSAIHVIHNRIFQRIGYLVI